MSTIDPSLLSSAPFELSVEEAPPALPDKKPSVAHMVDSIEKVVVAQKPNSVKRRAEDDAKIAKINNHILFQALNAMAKIIVAAEIERKEIDKEEEIHKLFFNASIQIARLHQDIIKLEEIKGEVKAIELGAVAA